MKKERKVCSMVISFVMAFSIIIGSTLPVTLQAATTEREETNADGNLIVNPGFENLEEGWTFSEPGAGIMENNPYTGQHGFYLDWQGNYSVEQVVTVPYSGYYSASAYLTSACDDGSFGVSYEDGTTIEEKSVSSGGYSQYTLPTFQLKQGEKVRVYVKSGNFWINGDDFYLGYDFDNTAVNLIDGQSIGENPIEVRLPWNGGYKFESSIATGDSEATLNVSGKTITVEPNTTKEVSVDLTGMKKDNSIEISVYGTDFQVNDATLFLYDDNKTILINGQPLEGFDPDITEYNVVLNENIKPNVTLADKETYEWVRKEGMVQQADDANGKAVVNHNGKEYIINFSTEDNEKNFFYLSDMDYELEKLPDAPDDALTVTKDASRNQHDGSKPLDIFSQTYEKGLGVHSGAKLSFALNGTCSKFVGAIGASTIPSDLWNDSDYGVLQVKVYLDGQLQDTIDLDCRRGDQMKVLNLDLAGKETLTFECLNGNGLWYDDYLAIADAKIYLQGECTEPENMEILFNGEVRDDFKFDPATEEYMIYVPEGTKDAPDVSVVNKQTGETVPAFIKQAGSELVTYNDGQTPDKVIDAITEVPDSAVLTIVGLPNPYRIRFIEDGEWRNISGEWYDYTETYEMREPSIHDYSQTLTMKVFCAKPDNRDQGTSQVAYRFDEVLDLIKKVDNLTFGIPKIIYLVGWQYTGHDDRYPSWDVVNENLRCKECNHKDATECLSSLMLEAKKYNTTVSLHINSTDAQPSSPLWDRYTENDLIAKKDGSYLAGGVWAGEQTYKINFTNEWDYGFYKARVDRLCEMLPIEEAGTIHSDAFGCSADDDNTLAEDQSARRKMIRYWRSKGVDLTTEFFYNTNENGDGEISYNPGTSDQIDTFVGDMPMAWHFCQSLEEFMKLPASLITGGAVNSFASPYDREETEILIGGSIHGEDIFTNYDATPVYAYSETSWVPEFINQFCEKTVPCFYLNQFDRELLSGEGNNKTVKFSDGVETAIQNKLLTKNGVVLRENGNLFIPISWKDNTILAYSESGYTNREWTFPDDWTSDASAVDIYNITKEGLQKLEEECDIKRGNITLSLEANQAVIIVPAGSEVEYIPSEFALTAPSNGDEIQVDSDAEFTWEESENARNYKLVIAKDEQLKDIVVEYDTEDTSVAVADIKDNLEKDQKYYWNVFASVSADSEIGIWSSETASAFFTDTTKLPENPADFVASIEGKNTVKLSWTDSSNGRSEFEIYRKEKAESDQNYQLLDTVKGTEYTDEVLNDETKAYSYKLVAKNSAGSAEPVYAETNIVKWLEFEEADSRTEGIQNESKDGGTTVGYTSAGAWFKYDKVDFGDMLVNKIKVRYAANTNCASDGAVEVHMDAADGELVASIPVPPTGGWDNFVTVESEIDETVANNLKGEHTLYLVLKGSVSSMGNYNWISFEGNSVSEDVDKSNLQNLYDSVRDLAESGYITETWSAFVTARDNAKAVLENTEATQKEVDAAAVELQIAIDALRVSKTTLEYFLNSAKEHLANGDADSSVESVRQLLEEAITEGEAVMSKEDATREEVMNATVKLMKAIQALDMKAGNKTDLEMAVELAHMIDLEKYVEKGQQEFKDALAAAETMMADGDAMQEDIDSAWNALVDAMDNLRLKANKDALEDLLNEVSGLELSKYTEESAAVLEQALDRADEVMADESLSVDDQAVVDEAVQELQTAIDGLVAKVEGTDDGTQNGGTQNGGTGNENSSENGGDQATSNGSGQNEGGSKAAKTGDTMPVGIPLAAVLVSGAAVIALKKKKR